MQVASGPAGSLNEAATLPFVRFDRPVSIASATGRVVVAGTSSAVPGALVFADPGHATVAFRPAAGRFAAGTTYTFTLTGVRAVAGGLPAAATVVTWRTHTATPVVTARSPGAGSSGFDRDGTVRLTMSVAVKGVTARTVRLVRVSTGAVVTVRAWASGRYVYLDPSARLLAGARYRVELRAGVAALDGTPAAPSSFTFTTGRT